ncbi:MAG: hypothetical protein ACKVOS_03305 [Sphingorhabdus sp.]|uniref:hypothetical protein n=1 Tax=Sphingorhabdus sp. TaxID=1902408 RepID=UPI0038FC5CE7
MVWVSDLVIEAMGFEKARKNMALTAKFHGLHVFHIKGIRVDEGALIVQTYQLDGNAIQVGVGNSVNGICRKMLSDSYADNEDEWQKEKNCKPPYVVIHLGPTESHTQNLRHFRRDGKTVHTYDTFYDAKIEIKKLANKLLPSIVTSLSCSLFENGRPLPGLVQVDKTTFGITPSGETVLDMRLDLTASANTSSGWNASSIRKALKHVSGILPKVDSKSASFFHLALIEKDALKRFLYFFLSIEIATHSSFGAIDHEQCVNQLSGKRAKSWMKDLSFLREVKKWPNLRDRFLWCALFVWRHISEEDVETFARLKKARDDIAHGNIREPNAADFGAAELLATKLHSFHQF